MMDRDIQAALEDLSTKFPVVTIVGPRQSGKTTLATMVFPEHSYVNLEAPDIRDLAENDPNEFLKLYPRPVIIDEIQRVPKLLSYIQVIVDREKIPGGYILTGSHQIELGASISQSLAGRSAMLRLLPLSISELKKSGIKLDRDELIFRGFMPSIHNESIDPESFYRNYMQTYIERDTRQILNIRHLTAFSAFMRLLAGRVGQEINLHSLSGDIGVSSTTLKEWLSVLEASFVVFRLPPYFENFGKRHVKAPKIYFTEIGLASYLLGIRKAEEVAHDRQLGGLFENMVVLDALKTRYNQGKDPEMYFFRDNSGLEIDLIVSSHRSLTPVEIKASRTFSADFRRNIGKYRTLSSTVNPGYVVYSGDLSPSVEGTKFVHFTDIHTLFSEGGSPPSSSPARSSTRKRKPTITSSKRSSR